MVMDTVMYGFLTVSATSNHSNFPGFQSNISKFKPLIVIGQTILRT